MTSAGVLVTDIFNVTTCITMHVVHMKIYSKCFRNSNFYKDIITHIYITLFFEVTQSAAF